VRTEDVHAAKQAVIDCVLEQITPSQAECGEIGSHLAWHATIVRLAKLGQADLILSMGDSVLQPSTVVRNLGVYTLTSIYPWKPMLVIVPKH